MRRIPRIVLLAGLAALMPVLSACENFDPDKLDVFGLNEKKKLPGDRRPLFPQGVPGVQQGIPPEFVKNNQAAPEGAQTPLAGQDNKTAAVEPAAEPKPKPKPKRAPKPPAATQPPPPAQFPTRITVQPQRDQQPPQDQQPAPQQAQAPWPSSPAPGSR